MICSPKILAIFGHKTTKKNKQTKQTNKQTTNSPGDDIGNTRMEEWLKDGLKEGRGIVSPKFLLYDDGLDFYRDHTILLYSCVPIVL